MEPSRTHVVGLSRRGEFVELLYVTDTLAEPRVVVAKNEAAKVRVGTIVPPSAREWEVPPGLDMNVAEGVGASVSRLVLSNSLPHQLGDPILRRLGYRVEFCVNHHFFSPPRAWVDGFFSFGALPTVRSGRWGTLSTFYLAKTGEAVIFLPRNRLTEEIPASPPGKFTSPLTPTHLCASDGGSGRFEFYVEEPRPIRIMMHAVNHPFVYHLYTGTDGVHHGRDESLCVDDLAEASAPPKGHILRVLDALALSGNLVEI